MRIRKRSAAGCLFIVSLFGFIPLLAASWLSGRDYQRELAQVTVDLWNSK